MIANLVSRRSKLVDCGKRLRDLDAAAASDHEGDTVLPRSGCPDSVDDLGQKRRRHVVDHVPPGVLQGVGGGGTTCT